MEGGAQTQTQLKSILVPCVQELAKESLEKVPHRYIRPFDDQDRPILPHDDRVHDDLQVPIIDMEALLSVDGQELQKLHFACQEWGFFQVINHGVDSSLVEKFKRETQEFFNLPMEEKKRYWQTPTDVEGFGQAFVVSEQQKLDWADLFYLITLPKTQRLARLLPLFPLPYRDTMDNYSAEVANLAMKILDCMAKALNVDPDVLRGIFGEGRQSFRMNCYPPCPQPDNVIGLTPHSDSVALTILLQLNDMDGLQIKKDGKWVSVRPLPHAFVVNIGDVLEIVTNGIYKSILHRAVVNATKERLSVAAFHYPASDREIGPIPNLITVDTPARFKRISMIDYVQGLFARELDGKSYLDTMRITENDEEKKSNEP